MIVIVVVLDRFTAKNKLITYIRAFVELYNWKNREQVYKIYRMVELEKWRFLTVKYPHSLSAYQIVEILTILHNAYVVLRDQDENIFYVNNYID